jgi:hypothetical protein
MRSISRTLIASAAVAVSVSACSDSTGPTVTPKDALQSIALGMGEVGGATTPEASTLGGALSIIEPFLNQVNVSVNGSSRTMYGFGVRETFPDGACMENIFVDPEFPPPPDVCTPAVLGATLLLWESHAANRLPDRILVISTDEGTTDYSFDSTDPLVSLPSVAFYIEGQDKLFISNGGTLSTHITSTGQGCSIVLPPYAKSAACNIAAFDEAGSIVFEAITDLDTETGAADRTIAIPRQTLHGIWEQIIETQPVTLTFPTAIRALLRQPVRAALLSSLGTFRKQVRR